MEITTEDNPFSSRPVQILQIALFGRSGVGKSTLIARLNKASFDQCKTIQSTIGVDYVKLPEIFSTVARTATGGKEALEVQVLCFDTMGQERFSVIVQSYYRSAQIAFLVCSAIDTIPFADQLKVHFTELERVSARAKDDGKRPPIVHLLLNKMDLVPKDYRQPLLTAIEKVARANDCAYSLISCREDDYSSLRKVLQRAINDFYLQPARSSVKLKLSLALSNLPPPALASTSDLPTPATPTPTPRTSRCCN